VYVKSVAIAALEAACASPQAGSALALKAPPTATEPVAKGWLEKLGEKKKTWKRRYFVATEEAGGFTRSSTFVALDVRNSCSLSYSIAENFVVFYFQSEADSTTRSKAKGAIYPCGYVISEAPSPAGAPEWYLTLAPINRKRPFLLRCETQELQAHWKTVFRYAAQKCKPPLSSDPILAAAFRQAYARTRRQLELRGSGVIDRAESDQLLVLCAQACNAGVIQGALIASGAPAVGPSSAAAAAVADPTPGASPEFDVFQVVDRVARELVASAWPALCARVSLRRDFVERKVSGSLAALQTERSARNAEVRARLNPVLADAAADSNTRATLDVVLGALLKPQYKAHKLAAKIFFSRCTEIIDRGLKESELRSFYRDTRWQEGALLPALRTIRALTRSAESDEFDSEASLRLLSELLLPLPQLEEMMQVSEPPPVLARCAVHSRCTHTFRASR
jgi:hypothetical protein